MGKPKLVYSPIQLRMANQYCIFPVGRLEDVEVDLARVKTYIDFEVINIMDEKDPYLSLLGIDWAYDNYGVIDLKKKTMTFDSDGIRVIQPLDPYQGPWYIEPVDDAMERDVLEQIYHLTTGKRANYINPTIDGSVSWRSIQSSDIDFEEALNDWKQRWNEISTRCCATIRVVRWIGTELRNPPVYDGTSDVNSFLTTMEHKAVEEYRIPVMDISLRATPAQWWATHKETLPSWDLVKIAMQHRFLPPSDLLH
jgi:hypothetical protein